MKIYLVWAEILKTYKDDITIIFGYNYQPFIDTNKSSLLMKNYLQGIVTLQLFKRHINKI